MGNIINAKTIHVKTVRIIVEILHKRNGKYRIIFIIKGKMS